MSYTTVLKKQRWECPLDGEKIAKNREKERENEGKSKKKRGKNQEKEEKSGRFFHFAPPDK